VFQGKLPYDLGTRSSGALLSLTVANATYLTADTRPAKRRYLELMAAVVHTRACASGSKAASFAGSDADVLNAMAATAATAGQAVQLEAGSCVTYYSMAKYDNKWALQIQVRPACAVLKEQTMLVLRQWTRNLPGMGLWQGGWRSSLSPPFVR
jgi:hypothetical protein